MKRPLIGLSGRRKKGDQIVDNPAILAELDFDMFYSDYARGVLEAGGLPLYLSPDIDPAEAIDHLDGLLLSGGTDVDPARYGAAPDPDLYTPEPDRDAFELALLDSAIGRELPTLGICRGIQVINVHAGGTLHQHVPAHSGQDAPPSAEAHQVEIEADSQLGAMYGTGRGVNSLHHQTIDALAPGFAATATAPDGTIEGIEHAQLPIVAVQWHPEMMTTRPTDPIFRWLVDSSRSR